MEKTDVICTGFGVSKNGDSLYLCDAYYELVQELNVPAMLTDASYARRSDGTYGFCGTPTPGEANTTDIAASLDELYVEQDLTALSITEVQPDGNGETWLELYNASDADVRLDNYYVSDSRIQPAAQPAAREHAAGGRVCRRLPHGRYRRGPAGGLVPPRARGYARLSDQLSGRAGVGACLGGRTCPRG